ncbi:Cytochrome c heme lyase subunit CcmH [Rhodovastum atsumiense]|uniref:c-type cytochrome biogenesis protein CcmI n=1 Tax=Rhodovastum atsumiense TaxID=504468 RepID=UPI00139F2A28|nr:c-type cytochrome biogenesis protein CcmI [Rhodovastum atsumiense]CAH2600198.1 Cytochrome c heme lyase subunit CcmH [Rhodovastum atsumiense]
MTAFVFTCALLALGVLTFVVLPLVGVRRALPSRARFDQAVYRDQLKELDRDIARGVVGEAEAQTARLEIERRLLAASDRQEPELPRAPLRRSSLIAGVVAVLVVAGASGLYLMLGAPGIPDAPYALRIAERKGGATDPQHAEMAKMAQTLAERLRQDPNNREGWQLYARTEATLGNWQEAAAAWRNLIALGNADADAYAGYGEMQVLAAQGTVTPAAREAFAQALKADAVNPIARFYLAAADAQAGEGQKAIDAWLKLAGEIADPDMRAELGRRIAQAARLSGVPVPTLPPPAPESAPEPGPTGQDVAAAANMSEAERATMIRGMVEKLAAKLQAEPNDYDGWLRLGRAYAVLGEHDQAGDAFTRAAALRPGDVTPLLQGVQALAQAQKEGAPLPQRAIALLHEAEQRDPKLPETLWYLGMAEAQSGRVDQARGYWERLLPLLPEGSNESRLVTEAIATLKAH